MKPAHQKANAERVSVWVLVRDGKQAGRIVTDFSRAGIVTTTLTLYAMDSGQEFKIGTAKGRYRPEDDNLAEILNGFGYPDLAKRAYAGDRVGAFGPLGLECWGVL